MCVLPFVVLPHLSDPSIHLKVSRTSTRQRSVVIEEPVEARLSDEAGTARSDS